jgi:hypothetical protein
MVVINTLNGKVYEDLNKTQVAEIVGVCRQTVAQWQGQTRTKQHKWYTVYLFSMKFKNIY